MGAFFAVSPQKTGLSACIFFACGKKGYRFYPLRVEPAASLPPPCGVLINFTK
jgi:hypothetical protein